MADRPTTLEALAAGHPAAERQLRALREIAHRWQSEHPRIDRPPNKRRRKADHCACHECLLSRELDAADAAARGES